MSNTQWTDAFLDQKRQQTDKTYDENIEIILDIARHDSEDYRQIVARLVTSQEDLIAKAAKTTEIDQLCVDQDRQYEEWDKLSSHTWPQGLQFHIDSARLATLLASKALANRHLQSALSAMNCALTNAKVLQRRVGEDGFTQFLKESGGEPESKEQAETPHSKDRKTGTDNLAAYTRFLQITADMPASPGLFLCGDAYRNAQYRSYPKILRDTFVPAPCPEWVDEEKLRLGFGLWQEHMAACVLVLFTHSLPACYLDAKGIPLLYVTRRLRDQKLLAHRVYETGFFLKDVMDEGGLSVLADKWAMHTAWLAAAVHRVRPDLNFELDSRLDPYWTDAEGNSYTLSHGRRTAAGEHGELPPDDQRKIGVDYASRLKEYRSGHGATSGDYSAQDLGCDSYTRLFRDSMQPSVGFRGRRLWGRAFLTATKVRYLHAWMRHMASLDPRFADVETTGRPINQEDMVFTLLTIGYVIPLGVEKLGGILSRAQKEAFLHCWRVVGHVMGVDDDLLTDDWDEAKALYEKIKSRQLGRSEYGLGLTNALCTLIEDLLPAWLPFRSAIAPVLIRDQLGADADVLFDDATKAASGNLLVRGGWAIAKHVFIRGYFMSRHWFFDRIPAARAVIDSQVRFLMTGLIESFQQTYERKNFDLFPQEAGIPDNPETTAAAQEARVANRKRAFTWVTVGMALMLLVHPLFWIGAASLAVACVSPAAWLGSAAISLFWSMFWLCFIAMIGMTIVEKRLKACLRLLAFKPHPE
jgi:hypothetical protein